MSTKTKFIWDDDNLLAEADGTNTTNTVYTNEPEQYGNLISSRISGSTSYHHFDAIGSTRQLSSAAGAVSETVIYDAWGTVVRRTEARPRRSSGSASSDITAISKRALCMFAHDPANPQPVGGRQSILPALRATLTRTRADVRSFMLIQRA